MNVTSRPEHVKVTQVPCIELSRIDIEIALRDYVAKRGYTVDSLFRFSYNDGVLHSVAADVKLNP